MLSEYRFITMERKEKEERRKYKYNTLHVHAMVCNFPKIILPTMRMGYTFHFVSYMGILSRESNLYYYS